MGQPHHTKLLTAAARRILGPLGLRQKGRSRLWLDDHGWWVVVVEFQPSGWSKGSYLNVGAMWLWWEKDYFSFDDGYRVANFVAFEHEGQFTGIAEDLARRAAAEVVRFRSRYPSVSAVAQQLVAQSPQWLWDSFHAAVACGLSGKVVEARRLFEQCAATDDPREWAQEAASVARGYAYLVADAPGFRRRIKEVILRARGQLRLGELAAIDFDEEQ